MKVVCLWSGGKDSCFACYQAIKLGLKVVSLFNFIDSAGNSLSHNICAPLIQRQAGLTDIPLLQKVMPQQTYRDEFKKLIEEWKNKHSISGIVFGDIYLQEHKDWIDNVCRELKVEAILPLWGRDTKELILDIINSGFKAVVVSARADLLGKEWLGRKINSEFVKDLNPEIDPCAEKGEFHTFVIDSPMFKKQRIEITKSRLVRKKCFGDYWVLDIKEYKVCNKEEVDHAAEKRSCKAELFYE